jgi:hypothetical protein
MAAARDDVCTPAHARAAERSCWGRGLRGLFLFRVRRRTDDGLEKRQTQKATFRVDTMKTKVALTDVNSLRARARKDIEGGAVTAGYSADRTQVLKLLNEALATEIVCVLRYRRHHFMARGIDATSTADEFLVHSNEEQGHADQIAERIVQLGGEPDFSPDSLTHRPQSRGICARRLTG